MNPWKRSLRVNRTTPDASPKVYRFARRVTLAALKAECTLKKVAWGSVFTGKETQR